MGGCSRGTSVDSNGSNGEFGNTVKPPVGLLLLPVFNGILQKSGNWRGGGAYWRFYGIAIHRNKGKTEQRTYHEADAGGLYSASHTTKFQTDDSQSGLNSTQFQTALLMST